MNIVLVTSDINNTKRHFVNELTILSKAGNRIAFTSSTVELRDLLTQKIHLVLVYGSGEQTVLDSFCVQAAMLDKRVLFIYFRENPEKRFVSFSDFSALHTSTFCENPVKAIQAK